MIVFGNAIGYIKTCRDPGSNQGPSDLQSDALPTELSRRQNVHYNPAHKMRNLPPSKLAIPFIYIFNNITRSYISSNDFFDATIGQESVARTNDTNLTIPRHAYFLLNIQLDLLYI